MFKYISATGGAIITIIITVRLVDRGVWKRVFPTLHCRLCRSGIGVKNTQNTSVVGTMGSSYCEQEQEQPAQPGTTGLVATGA